MVRTLKFCAYCLLTIFILPRLFVPSDWRNYSSCGMWHIARHRTGPCSSSIRQGRSQSEGRYRGSQKTIRNMSWPSPVPTETQSQVLVYKFISFIKIKSDKFGTSDVTESKPIIGWWGKFIMHERCGKVTQLFFDPVDLAAALALQLRRHSLKLQTMAPRENWNVNLSGSKYKLQHSTTNEHA